MKIAFSLALALLVQPSPSVRESFGNIEYIAADGASRPLTNDGLNGDPVLSPDGSTVAFIHIDAKPANGEGGVSSLWIGNGPAGTAHRLVAPHTGADVSQEFTNVHKPIFSLDGGFIYVSAEAWATSEAVHQVSVAGGKERFVIDGWLLSVIRTGRWRGYLLVGRHKYYGPPNYGSYNPVYVVRPDGKETFMVPGSDKDEGDKSLGRWLAGQNARAW